MATANVTMRMDEELKNQLQELVSNLGMDLTTFYHNSKTGCKRTTDSFQYFHGNSQHRNNSSYRGSTENERKSRYGKILYRC